MHSITLRACLSEPTIKIWMQIDEYCQLRKCSSVNVVSSDIRVMQIFARVREIWGVKQESDRLRCRFSYLSLTIFSESSSPRLKSATHSICVKLLQKHDKLTQCCRAFNLALARLSCYWSYALLFSDSTNNIEALNEMHSTYFSQRHVISIFHPPVVDAAFTKLLDDWHNQM